MSEAGLRQKEPGWIRMDLISARDFACEAKDGADIGQSVLLQCLSLKPHMTKCFAEVDVALCGSYV